MTRSVGTTTEFMAYSMTKKKCENYTRKENSYIKQWCYQGFGLKFIFIYKTHLWWTSTVWILQITPSLKLPKFFKSSFELSNLIFLNIETWCNSLSVPKSWVFNGVPNWFTRGFLLCHISWSFSSVPWKLWFYMFGNILQLSLLSTMKNGHILLINSCQHLLLVRIQGLYKFAICHLLLLLLPHALGDNNHHLSTNKLFTQQKLLFLFFW